MRWFILAFILLTALVITWQVDVHDGGQFATYAYPAIIIFAAISTLFLKYSGFLKRDGKTNREMS